MRTGNGVRRMTRRAEFMEPAEVNGFAVTSKVQTAVDLALRYSFPWAVAVMDRLLNADPLPGERSRRPVCKAEVEGHISIIAAARRRARLTRVLDFANGLAMSPGESISRVHMAARGFAPPELQHPVHDAQGHAGDVDFYWKGARIAGEFDGRTKYMKAEYLRGRTSSQVVIAEKVREDRIRAVGLHVVRWLWETAVSPAALERCLRSAGVPQNAEPLRF
jgi:hypothetical protein